MAVRYVSSHMPVATGRLMSIPKRLQSADAGRPCPLDRAFLI